MTALQSSVLSQMTILQLKGLCSFTSQWRWHSNKASKRFPYFSWLMFLFLMKMIRAVYSKWLRTRAQHFHRVNIFQWRLFPVGCQVNSDLKFWGSTICSKYFSSIQVYCCFDIFHRYRVDCYFNVWRSNQSLLNDYFQLVVKLIPILTSEGARAPLSKLIVGCSYSEISYHFCKDCRILREGVKDSSTIDIVSNKSLIGLVGRIKHNGLVGRSLFTMASSAATISSITLALISLVTMASTASVALASASSA